MNRIERTEWAGLVIVCAVIGGALLVGQCGCTEVELQAPDGTQFRWISTKDVRIEGDLQVDPETRTLNWQEMLIKGDASTVAEKNWQGANDLTGRVLGFAGQMYALQAAQQPADDDERLVGLIRRMLEAELQRRFPPGPPEPKPDEE